MKPGQNRVTAVVCCYNEEERIGAVLEVLSNHELIEEVIVVNDGNQDNSAEVIKKYPVKLIQNPDRLGKGQALKKAMSQVKTELTFMCDADLIGLKSRHVSSLIEPVLRNDKLMTIAVLDKYWHMNSPFIKKHFTVILINGTRVLRSDHLREACENGLSAGWGIETVINHTLNEKGIAIKKIDLKNVKDVIKTRKKNHNLSHHLNEIKEVVGVSLTLMPKYARFKASHTHNKIIETFFQRK